MKYFFSILLSVTLIVQSNFVAAEPQTNEKPARPLLVTKPLPTHPRLMLTPSVYKRVSQLIAVDPWAKRFFHRIQLGADMVLEKPVIERKLKGVKRFRMLATSRDALHNIVTLGLAHKFAPSEKYRKRIIDEMLSIAVFVDWHPSHFLDTAEMTFAMAIGYDWMYDELTSQQRQIIRDAIIKHGLQAALKNKGGLTSNTNWNQVRHAGLIAGALVVYEQEPELAEEILHQAKDNYKRALSPYKGDGVYPEGPTYWGYGTSFSFLMSACLQSALGNDWGILEYPGFAKSFDFILQSSAPSQRLFNFADCGLGPMFLPIHMWAGNMLNRPDFINVSMQSLERYIQNVDTTSFRINAFSLLWYKPLNQFKQIPTPKVYVGQGSRVHVATLRSAWNDLDASFIGLKGGHIQVNHGHMDIGSFIIEADAVRWAVDIGVETEIYDRRDGWSTKQESKRWTYFRVNNFSHNTLTFNGKIQQVKYLNPIIASEQSDEMSWAILDMSNAYKGQVDSAKRGIALFKDKTMLVQDQYTGMQGGTSLLWNMATESQINIADDGKTAMLSQGKQSCIVKILEPVDARFSIKDATPPTAVEKQNENIRRLVIELENASKDGRISIWFVPGSTPGIVPGRIKNPTMPKVESFENWAR